MSDTQTAATGVLVSFAIIIACSLLASSFARAEEIRPSKEDYQNLEDIKSNQKILEKNRKAYETFLQAKRWNEEEVRQLNANGWNVDWETMELVPFGPVQAKASSTEYVWKNAPEYKNERLRAYQRMLKARGITNKDHLRLLVAQLIQEAGSLSETTIGDSGCSLGIPQLNTCVHHNQKAETFLKSNPEWGDWRHQLEWMADRTATNYQRFDQNVRLTIIAHNCPACARAGKDSRAGYFRAVTARLSLLTSL